MVTGVEGGILVPGVEVELVIVIGEVLGGGVSELDSDEDGGGVLLPRMFPTTEAQGSRPGLDDGERNAGEWEMGESDFRL